MFDDTEQDRPEDTDWCEWAGMSYGMKRAIDDSLRMFLPDPFHDGTCTCWRCRNSTEGAANA